MKNREMANNRVIIIDGYDGSGKTTLAELLCEILGGCYIKSYSGTLSQFLWWLLEKKEYHLMDCVARKSFDHACEINKRAPYLIFDRQWMTMCTLLPREYHGNWKPLPVTIHCTAEVEIISKRLLSRGEKKEVTMEEHQEQCDRFAVLAKEHNIPVVNTTHDTPSQSLEMIVSLLPAGWIP